MMRAERFLMIARPWAMFSIAPVDQQAGESGRSFGGGQDVADAIAGMFSRLGAKVVVEDAKDDHWTFSIVFRRHRFFCRIVSLQPGFALRLDEIPVWWSPRKPPLHADLVVAFNRELSQDPRFRDLLWFTREDGPSTHSDGGGTQDPLAPAAGLAMRPARPTLGQMAARVLGWLLLLLAALAILDPLSTDRAMGVAYLAVAAFLLSVGHRVRRVFGVRLPWVRDES
jgi:hypothetical protein